MAFRITSNSRARPAALSAFADEEDEEDDTNGQSGTEAATEAAAAAAHAGPSHAASPGAATTFNPIAAVDEQPQQLIHQPGQQNGQVPRQHQHSPASQAAAQHLVAEGVSHAEAGSWAAAMSCWDRACTLTPGDAALQEMRAQVLLEVGAVWEAVRAASAATQLRPEWAAGHATLGRAQLALGEVALGLASLEAAAALDPGDADLAVELGGVRVLAGQQRAAGLGATRLPVVSAGQ